MKNWKLIFVLGILVLAILLLFAAERFVKAESSKSTCKVVVQSADGYKEIRECCVFESGTLIFEGSGMVGPMSIIPHGCSEQYPFGWNELPLPPQATPAAANPR